MDEVVERRERFRSRGTSPRDITLVKLSTTILSTAIACSTKQFELNTSHELLVISSASLSRCIAALYSHGVFDHAYACVKHYQRRCLAQDYSQHSQIHQSSTRYKTMTGTVWPSSTARRPAHSPTET